MNARPAAEFAHRFVETNGIRMHYAEAGSGPLVVLCHGFPELWYSWRHQLRALAAAGFHAVAPDLRGYGQTDRPPAVEAYDIFQLTGDLVGLVNALDETPAALVGHDWGAAVTYFSALLRPDLFPAIGLLSVPYAPRGHVRPSQWEQEEYPGKIFYQAVFRSPMGEQIFQGDTRAVLLRGLYAASGDADPKYRWNPVIDPSTPPLPLQVQHPPWLTDQDLDYMAGEFARTGFTGGLNYYRNVDRNWELTPFLDAAKLRQPALFVAGERDAVIEFRADAFNALESIVPNLRKKVLLAGAGHWIQQERPEEVSRLLIEFLRGL